MKILAIIFILIGIVMWFISNSANRETLQSNSDKINYSNHNRNLTPYSIVCSEDGKFNFVTNGGYVWPLHDFSTKQEAITLRDQMQTIDEQNKRESRQWTTEERRLMNEVASKKWGICKKAE